ncbi:MAG: cation:proton antiporter [Balneolales bacterium]
MFETILALTFIFVSATIVLIIFGKFGQPAIPAYIVAGIIAGIFIDELLLLDLVQFGIIFLTFILGVRSGSQEVLNNLHNGYIISLIQLSLIFAISYGAAYLMGFNYLNATYFSIAAALSSTLVEYDSSIDIKELKVVYRRLSESMNVIEDFVAILIITVISIIPISLETIGITLLYAILIFTLGYFTREYAFPWLVKIVEESSEFVLLIGLSILSGFIWFCVFLEISIIVGAFVAGMALSKYPYDNKVIDTMGSLMNFFSVIFFVTLGALILMPVKEDILFALTIVFITMIIKPMVIILVLIWQGYKNRTAFNTATQLDHVSEFALMIAIQASLIGIIDTSLFNAIILSAIITITLSSYTTKYNEKLYYLFFQYIFTKITKHHEFDHHKELLHNHIILVGYGVKGKRIIDTLKKKGEKVLVIENDPPLISILQSKHESYLFADALDSLTWKSAKIDMAKLVIVTAPSRGIAQKALKQNTKADIIVTSYDASEAQLLLGEGALYIFISLFLAREFVENAIKDIMDGDPNHSRNYNIAYMKEQQS